MADQESSEETKLCNNCKKQISAANFIMHEMHCKRHISVCKHCGESIPKGEMNVHFEENHAKIKCGKCGTEVEKVHLEEHEENACPKKPMKCHYCELEFARSELPAHLDYCGSRTEPCTRCSQNIMLKDQLKHEESNCAYPPVKPANNNNQRTAENFRPNDLETDYPYRGHQGFDPFTLDELSRVLARPNNSPGRDPVAASAPIRNTVVKDTNTRSKRKQGVTVTRNRDTADRSPAGVEDYDRLLAMHLAQDLNQDEDIEELIRSMEKPKSPVMPTFTDDDYVGRMNVNTFVEDTVLIPCEFCGEPCPADDLVQHQSGCHLDKISAMLPPVSTGNDRVSGSRVENNRSDLVRRNSSPVQPAIQPEIIDNLRDLDHWSENRYGVPVQMIDDGDDNVMMLPCEFCSEPFPMETLIQHQAICESNATLSPRDMSAADSPPRASTRPNRKRSTGNTADRLEADFPNLSSRRHQPPPVLGLGADSDDEVSGNRRFAGASRSKVNGVTGSGTPNNIRTTLKKYGVRAEDRGDHYTRPVAHSRQPHEVEREHQSGGKRATGAARTRSTLDSLLGEDQQPPTHDLLGHLTAGRKNPGSSRTSDGASKGLGVRGVPAPKTKTTARDVRRELERGNPTPSNTRTSRSQTDTYGRVPASSDENTAPTTRQRTRATNVFGASSKPAATRRRPENS